MTQRIVVAMSGGVDSSVAAALLLEQGYDVVGIMLRLWGEDETGYNRCCSPSDTDLARHVADSLGFPLYLLDAADLFKAQVVDPFIAEYVVGRTPNPCLRCNRYVRFGWLLDKAMELDASKLATGHYARCKLGRAGWQLLRGLDPSKDQSYVLSVLTQAQLARVMFPLGELTKSEVRQIAERKKLPVAHKPDSQDLCFAGGQTEGDYRQFLTRHAPPGAIQPGPIRDTAGRVLGQHTGLPFYTIGQRKGLGISASQALYVISLVPQENTLIVGTASELGRDECSVESVNYISGQMPDGPFKAAVKIRYKALEVNATVTPIGSDEAHIKFDQPLRDITPGQSAVFYDGEVVIGGGLIV